MKKIKYLQFIGLISIICISGIIAYFTDTIVFHNESKIGIVDIELNEYMIDKNGDKVLYHYEDSIVNGQSVSLIPEITCKEISEPCYIRAKLNFDSDTMSFENLNIDYNKWIYNDKDGYLYYTNILDYTSSAIIFDTVKFNHDISSLDLESIKLQILVEAIQAQNIFVDFKENIFWDSFSSDDIIRTIYPSDSSI